MFKIKKNKRIGSNKLVLKTQTLPPVIAKIKAENNPHFSESNNFLVIRNIKKTEKVPKNIPGNLAAKIVSPNTLKNKC